VTNRKAPLRATSLLGLAPLGFALLSPALAWAYDVQVDASVIGQGYQLRAADSSIVDRRRLTTYLGLSLWNLGSKTPDGLPGQRNQWSLTFSMRFDTDLGDYLCNIGRSSFSAPLSCVGRGEGGQAMGSETRPELQNFRPELLFGYVEGRNLGGYVDLRLGRQIQMEMFDVRGLDGLYVEVHTPFYMAAEAWGGLNVTGALPIDSPIYAMDGTSHTAQNEALQPTFGVAVRSYGFRDLQARLSYRRSFSLTQEETQRAPGCPLGADGRPTACAPGGVGTIEDRLAYSLRGRLLDGRLIGWGGLRYDFLNGRFDEGNAGVRGYLTPQHSIALEYLYNAPTWDGDSIFNVFATSPINDLRLQYDGRFGDLRAHARLFGRRFEDESGDRQLAGASPLAYGATAGARYDRRMGFVRADLYYDGGYGGQRAGADLAGRLRLVRDLLGLEGRLTYMYWADGGREQNNTHSFGMQLGARYAVTRGVLLHILAENNINRFYASQLRLVALVDLSYYLAPRSVGAATWGLPSAGMGSFPGRAL
jgi:hypothetical protein